MTTPLLRSAGLGVTASVNTTVGAPGPTAVFSTTRLPDAAGCETLLRRAYPRLRRQSGFSKAIFVAPGPDGRFLGRFLQLTGAAETMFGVAHAGRDCVNSTVAAYSAIAADATATIVNADTGLVVAVSPSLCSGSVDVEVRPATPVRPADVVLATPGCPGVLAVRVNNPYVLLDANVVGLSARELLGLTGPADPVLLRPVTDAVAQVQAQLGLPAGGDLPKLAVLAAGDRDTIAARTIYHGRWHPGLPLTGAITFLTAALVPRAPWYHRDVLLHGLRLRTPAGDIRVSTGTDQGALTSYHIPAREVTRDVAPSFI
ncbi:hypothetical protein ACN27G_29695 [Plantactinospora sp. WMMB334]|uniref:hypothetical protein n=1 Tax=Plantactinospora sp. WMMB334 TaxID=3404119 RepID=UPI003B939365